MTDDLRPGIGADFLFYSDYVKENFHVMRSTIFDIMEQKLILSQSTPPLLPSAVKKEIVLTYLTKQEGRPARLGFPSRIVELLRNYELASQDRVAAILVHRTGPTTQFELRIHYRLKVTSDSDLKLSYQDRPLNLHDISIGGARFGFQKPVQLETGKRVPLTLEIEGEPHPLEAEVLRVWTPDFRGQQDWTFATVKFLHAGGATERLLGEKIFRIQRELLANNKFLN
ncbi:MAG: PilZ domain-containing protein [Deltaproteobacteria bacterium]|nr:PilZ domain-containing protein [Deltaproteobacteria bacterium]